MNEENIFGFSRCQWIIDRNNEKKRLNDEEKTKITNDVIERMANDGLRTICIAYRDLGKDEQNWEDDEKIVRDLICIGIVGIEDPVRKEVKITRQRDKHFENSFQVPAAIEQCQRAGVVVRMVTGDNVNTARSIAMKCGIIKADDNFLILEGKEFNRRIRDDSGKVKQKLDVRLVENFSFILFEDFSEET